MEKTTRILSANKFPWAVSQFERWVTKRTPVDSEITLNHKRIYIFPSGPGFGFLLLIVLLWLMATNYENNLVFSLCFLLTALFVVAIHYSHANLSGITLRAVRATSVFAGQTTRVDLCISQQSERFRDNIELAFQSGESVTVTLSTQGDTFVSVLLATKKRGYLPVERLKVQSYYPLGLFRVWSYARFRVNGFVYPHPVKSPFSQQVNSARGEGAYQGISGSDDYAGLHEYRAGESLKHIAWKHYAREQGLWTKQYADPVERYCWVDWDHFPGLDREQRLSRMSWQVCELSEQNAVFGLRLPGDESKPGAGKDHRDRLLRKLALFELAPHDRGSL